MPPVTCEATLGSLQQLTTLKRLSLDFAEGIGNAEMQSLRLPSSLKAMTLLEPIPASNIFRDMSAAVGFLAELRGLRECHSAFTWLDHQLPSYAPLSSAMQGLETLILTDRVLDADTLAAFGAAAPWLREVKLVRCTMRDGDTSAVCSFLESLRSAKSVTLAKLEGCDSAAPLLESVSHLGSTLTDLHLFELGPIDDTIAKHVSKLTGLTTLCLEGMGADTALSERFVADGLAPLTKTLRTLHLAWVADSFDDAALRRLATVNNSNLQELVLHRCDGVAGPGIAALAASCTRLHTLDWRGSEQLDAVAALDAALALPALQLLNLSSTPPQLSSGGREPKPTLEPSFLAPPTAKQATQPQRGGTPSQLHMLLLQHCHMADEQLAARVASLPQLRTLVLNNCPNLGTGGALVSALKTSCPRLSTIALEMCGITDASLMNLLAQLGSRLAKLAVRRCSGLSAGAAAAVTEQLAGEDPTGGQLPWQRALAAGRHININIEGSDEALGLSNVMGGMMGSMMKLALLKSMNKLFDSNGE